MFLRTLSPTCMSGQSKSEGIFSRISEMNRHILDFFGFDSTRLNPDGWPNYLPSSVSPWFLTFLIRQHVGLSALKEAKGPPSLWGFCSMNRQLQLFRLVAWLLVGGKTRGPLSSKSTKLKNKLKWKWNKPTHCLVPWEDIAKNAATPSQ